VLLVGVGGSEHDPPPADDDQGRLEVGEVVIENGRVVEGQADVRMADLDPAGPLGALRGDADLEQPGRISRDVRSRDGPGRRPPDERERPGFDDRAQVVLVERLDEDAGRTFCRGLDPGRPERDAAHPEIVEVKGQPGPFGRPELRLEEAEIGIEVAAPEEVLKADDEGRYSLGGRRGRGLTRDAERLEGQEEEEPQARFSHGDLIIAKET
jgi:hypothetical protein